MSYTNNPGFMALKKGVAQMILSSKATAPFDLRRFLENPVYQSFVSSAKAYPSTLRGDVNT